MNVKLVIDAIVRQTTILIAELATSAGMRAPLAHIANQTFLSLVGELERQGIGQKVIADMFGLALRSYQQKVQRLSESATDHGRSLWEAMHDYLVDVQVVSRAEVLRRFSRDDQASVRGILSDLVDSGLVYKTGRGDATVYRAAPQEEIAQAADGDPLASAIALCWITIYREGPLGRAQLRDLLPLDDAVLDQALQQLTSEGRVAKHEANSEPSYRADECFIALGEGAGWEAALLDHYQAVVRAICAKLNQAASSAQPADRIGGSTFSFDVWDGHPHAERTYGLLARFRAELGGLWDDISQYNDQNPRGGPRDRVTFYFGQMVTSDSALDQDSAERE